MTDLTHHLHACKNCNRVFWKAPEESECPDCGHGVPGRDWYWVIAPAGNSGEFGVLPEPEMGDEPIADAFKREPTEEADADA